MAQKIVYLRKLFSDTFVWRIQIYIKNIFDFIYEIVWVKNDDSIGLGKTWEIYILEKLEQIINNKNNITVLMHLDIN